LSSALGILPACAISSGVPEWIQIRLNILLAVARKKGSGGLFHPAGRHGQILPGGGNSCRAGRQFFPRMGLRQKERERRIAPLPAPQTP
jgi:hypothetical protein